MADYEKTLEFDKIKEKLIQLAYTDKAKEILGELKPYLSETELLVHLRETGEARLLLEKAGNPPLTAMQGIAEMIDIARKGGCLSAEQLEGIGAALAAVKRLKDYLNRCKQYEAGLAYYEENLNSLEEIREQLNLKIRNGKVDDYASKLLKSLRTDIDMAEQKMREKAEAVMRVNKECMSDSFSTMRNGRICIPVKKEYKFKISGSLIDKSSTGNTLFIEPAAAAKYYEQLQCLKLDEENEVQRVLYELSDLLADKSEVIEENNKTIEKLDFVFAKGKLSMDYNGVRPQITNSRKIHLVNARHPLMDQKINIPLNFRMGKGIKGIIITGPNTGGKTIALKTVALSCLMAQCGLHVACESAEVCMNNAYLCDIGDGQDLSENLSTFSAHINNVLDILQRANKDSLVILDELGSGTDPTEGMGIAIAILEELKLSGALYLITTHYPEVKNYAEKETQMVNARMTFDKESLKPLYQLIIGEAGESCAFYIARRLGMPSSMLKRAFLAAYGCELPRELCDLSGDMESLEQEGVAHEAAKRIVKKKKNHKKQAEAERFHQGDSVMIFPDKMKGIVCEAANEKGVLRIQLPDKKIWINHKRIKLLVAAEELYPQDYDFSIIFDSVENRKAKHQMEKRHIEGLIVSYKEES